MTPGRRKALRAVTFDCWQTLLADAHLGAARELRTTALVEAAAARGHGMGTVRLRAAHDDVSGHPEADAVADSHAELLELLRARLP